MPDHAVQHRPSGWAMGFTAFAGTMMIVVGLYHAFVGLAGVLSGDLYVSTKDYIFSFDSTTWGWLHLALGVVVLLAGLGVFSGRVWARAVGVIIASISAIANFLFVPSYPLWALLIIAADIAVIWALTAHGRDFAETA